MFDQLLPDTLVQAGGWAILHSLWQGAIITLLSAFMLGQTRQQKPALRYHLSVGALFLLLGAVVTTFLVYYQPAYEPADLYTDRGAVLSTYYLADTATTAGQQPDLLQGIFPVLLQVWLIGVALMGVRMLGELTYLQRLRSTSNTQAVDAPWMERLNAMKWQMGILQPVALRESLRVSSPMLVGWIKPVILLPVGMLSGLSVRQVECILAHELAHLQRMDYVVNLIQSAIEVLLFFNPAVWWISAQIREEREHCCDELALSLTGDRLTFVKTLAQLEEWRVQNGHLGLAFNGRPQGVLGRVQRLLGGESSVRIIGKGLWSLLFFSLTTGLLAFHNQHEDNILTRQWNNSIDLIAETQQEKLVNDYRKELALNLKERTLQQLETTRQMQDLLEKASSAPFIEELPMTTLSGEQFLKLVTNSLQPLATLKDTIPKEKWEAEMRALQEEMNKLHEAMTNSAEMKQLEELTQKYEKEMRVMQEKMMSEQGGYEKMAEEQRRAIEKVEQKHRALMESEDFKDMQREREKIAEQFSRQADLLQKKYQDKPYLLEYRMDSLSNTFEDEYEVFEEKYEVAMDALEQEMENLENNPEMRALHSKMEAIQEEMERLMETQMEPMQEQMEQLYETMEEKFEQRMEVLQQQMEKLHQQGFKREE